MELKPASLPADLQKRLHPVYLVSGEEPLQIQEATDAIRAAAREAGCSEREIFDIDRYFDWSKLHAAGAEMSLFAERKLIELNLPSGKPGADGSKALVEYLADPGDNILLILAGKIDKQSMSSKWFKTIDRAGAWMRVWPISLDQLPHWLDQRFARVGLKAAPDVLTMLADRVEGNLLAAAQEIEKLRLLCDGDTVTLEDIGASVANNTRYDLFELVDEALSGNVAHSLRMMQGLRAEGTAPAVVLWAIAKEIRVLYLCRAEMDQGKNAGQAMQAQRVWRQRMKVVGAGLARHSLDDLGELLHRANLADQAIKGMAAGNPWDHLSQLLLELGRGRLAA